MVRVRAHASSWVETGVYSGIKVRPDKHLDLLFTSVRSIQLTTRGGVCWGGRSVLAFDRLSLGVVVVRTGARGTRGICICWLLNLDWGVIRGSPFF